MGMKMITFLIDIVVESEDEADVLDTVSLTVDTLRTNGGKVNHAAVSSHQYHAIVVKPDPFEAKGARPAVVGMMDEVQGERQDG